MSDYFGARRVMYWVLGGCSIACFLLVIPRMDVYATGEGIMAARPGEVTAVADDRVVVGDKTYTLVVKDAKALDDDATKILPSRSFWQVPAVKQATRSSRSS